MKKTLIALTVLAASGTTMAQSSVSISGNVNLGVLKQTGSSAKLDFLGSNNLKFSGTEDLGGGLKANFVLGHRFSPESGGLDGTANARPFWQSESSVGLSGNFGAIKLGRMLTALQGPVGASDPWGTWYAASVHALVTGYSTDARQADSAGAGRTDVITYASPNVGGFSGAVSLGLKNSAAAIPATTGAKNLGSLWLSYANGPVMVGGGYEKNRSSDDVAAILGSYDFGVAKLMAGYSQVDKATTAGPKGKNWNIGVSAPFGAFTGKLGYYNVKAEGTEVKTTKLGIGGEYALSKRTYLFTTFGRTKVETAANATKSFDLGIGHSF